MTIRLQLASDRVDRGSGEVGLTTGGEQGRDVTEENESVLVE